MISAPVHSRSWLDVRYYSVQREAGGDMGGLTRRAAAGALGAAGLCWSFRSVVAAAAPAASDRLVRLSGDGLGLTPRAYGELLNQLCQKADVGEDNYLLGGEVEGFERSWAKFLGK